ncbi:MAG: amino acid ABC transporter permease [Leifsonia sp.]
MSSTKAPLMVRTVETGRVDTVDASQKPRIHRKRPLEYVSWAVFILLAAGLAYSLTTNPNYQWGVVAQYFTSESILRGLGLTLVLTAVSMLLGTLIGLLVAVMRASSIRPIMLAASAYITFFRGTPVLVQLIFWFNLAALYPHLAIGIPFTNVSQTIDVNQIMSATTAAIIGLSLNEAAYMAEIIRGGFTSVGKGQLEAADSLGMSGMTKLRKIIIPQAMPAIIPATGNQVIGMFKETSLVSVLGVAELLQSAQLIYARTYQTIPLLIVACLWYLAMTLLLSYPQSLIEKRYSRSTAAIGRTIMPTEPAQIGEGK